MKRNLNTIMAITSLMASLPALSDNNDSKETDLTGFYVGAGLASTSETRDHYDFNDDLDGAGLFIVGGYHFTNWFGLEGLIITNSSDGAATSLRVTPKFTLQVSESLSLFTKVGLSFVMADDPDHCDSSSSYNRNDDDDDDIFDDDIFDKTRPTQSHKSTRYSTADSSYCYDDARAGFGYSVGAGANYHLSRSWALRLGVEYVDAKTEYDNFDLSANHELTTLYGGVYFQF